MGRKTSTAMVYQLRGKPCTFGIIQWANDRLETRNVGLVGICDTGYMIRMLEPTEAPVPNEQIKVYKQWADYWPALAVRTELKQLQATMYEKGKDVCSVAKWTNIIDERSKTLDAAFEHMWIDYVKARHA